MKNKEQAMEAYEAPKVEVIEVEVEKGFAGSGTAVSGSSYSETIETGSGSYPW